MSTGNCKLCLQSGKELRESHFMPRSLYAHCRTDEYEPVKFTRELLIPTSRQTKHPLFCSDCEQLLSRDGESWVLPLLPTLEGPFPLRERLMKQAPVYQDADKALYATATNPEIDRPKLMHFAVGIFYKAAVHSWIASETKPRIDLSEGETAALRLNLLGQADLPKNLALCITIDSSPVVFPAMIDPYRAESPNFRWFVFYVPGLFAQLLIGKGVQETLAANCINSNPLGPVLIEDVSKPMRNKMRGELNSARKTKKLIETTDEIEKRGLSIRLGD